MEKIQLKSNLLIKLFGSNEITLDELHNIDNILLDGNGIVFNEDEIKNIKSDLEYVFDEIKENYSRDISIINCPDFLKDYIIKNAATDKIYFEGYEEYFNTLKQRKINISNEFRKYFANDSEVTEYDLYEYVKTAKFLELDSVITLKDYDIMKNYANIADFKIKISNEEDYNKLQEISDGKDIEILVDKSTLKTLINKKNELEKNNNFIIEAQDMSELSNQELENISNKANIESIYIPPREDRTIESRDCYSIEEYYLLKNKIDNVLSQVDNSKPDIDRFMQIYQILGKTIEYEFDEDGEPASRDEAHNLKGRIIRKKMCV